MVKQIINIGVAGNDGTGDAMRDAFKKSNENFTELYSILGQENGFPFTALADYDPTNWGTTFNGKLVSNTMFVVDDAGTKIVPKQLIGGEGISIINTDSQNIIIRNTGARLAYDTKPSLGGSLNAQQFAIGNLKDPNSTDATALNVDIDTFAINKGYADTRYVNITGDTMTGALNAVAGAIGTEVPQVQEVVTIGGSDLNRTMTDALYLHDHPGVLSGVGKINGEDDLQAATKYYVDSATNYTKIGFYVSNDGNDFRPELPINRRGRALAYAFATIGEACYQAQRIIDAADVDLGPYKKDIIYIDGSNHENPSLVYTMVFVSGITYRLDITHGGTGTIPRKGTNYDIHAGLLIKGKSSGAIVKIDKVLTIQLTPPYIESYYVEKVNGMDLLDDEEIEYGDAVRDTNITIHIESGEYYENYPIKVPENVSLVGDEMRRTIISPKPGPSASRWADLYFRRDRFLDGLQITESSTVFGRHYLTDPSTELYSKTFTNAGGYTNAARILIANKEYIKAEVIGYINYQISHNVAPFAGFSYNQTTCSRDVGYIVEAFAYDLEYGGYHKSVNAASSYFANASGLEAITTQNAQTVAAISYINTISKRIAHNQLPVTTYQTLKTQNTELTANTAVLSAVQSAMNQLTQLIQDVINQDASYNTPINNDQMDVLLMNDSTNIREVSLQGHGGFAVVLDPEGQIISKSPYMHTVSSFTKSTNTHQFAGGMYIDGFCGNLPCTITNIDTDIITVEGLDVRNQQTPCSFIYTGVRFQVDYISEFDPVAGTANLHLNANTLDTGGILSNGLDIELVTAGNRSALATHFTQVNDLGYGIVVTNQAVSEIVSVFTYYCYRAFYSINGGQIRSLNGSCAYGVYALTAEGGDPTEVPDTVALANDTVQVAAAYTDATYKNQTNDQTLYVDGYSYIPYNSCEAEVDHGGAIGIIRYAISSAIYDGLPTGVIGLNINTSGNNNTSSSAIKATITDNTPVTIRLGQNMKFTGVANTNPSKTTNALSMEGNYYAVQSYSTKFLGADLPANTAILYTRELYQYVLLIIDSTSGTTMGQGQVGNNTLRIIELSTENAARVVGMKFGWGATLHTVQSYTAPVSPFTYATIALTSNLTKTTNLSTLGYNSVTIRAGVASGASGNITNNISTMRASGHDLLNIGTGGVADSNYPNDIYGPPVNPPSQDSEIQEISTGRVFFATTDQDGNFRVGSYFKVNQGTGTVTFAASIAISNLDGIGFKNGVTVSEFSVDDTLSANSTEKVPVEKAIRSYIDKRLGMTHSGTVIDTVTTPTGVIPNTTGGFLAVSGTIAMRADLNMGSHRLTNLIMGTSASDGARKDYVDNVFTNADTVRTNVLGFHMVNDSTLDSGRIEMNGNRISGLRAPTDGLDAVNKNYADSKSYLSQLSDVTLTSPATSQILSYNGSMWVNSSIVNANVDASAAIAQSKLSLSDSTAAGTSGAATKGIASFSSANFDATSGYVSIKDAGVTLAKMANLGSGNVIGRSTTGSGVPEAIAFSTVVQNGGALYDSQFSSNGAIVRTGASAYGIVGYSSTNTVSYLVQRDSSGDFAARYASLTQLNIGGNKTLSNSGTSPNQNIILTTPQGSDFLTATGSSVTAQAYGAWTWGSSTTIDITAGTFKTTTLSTGAASTAGTVTGAWTLSGSSKFEATYAADLAEYYEGDQQYEPGTVLMIGGDKEVTLARGIGNRAVAGVVSDNAAYSMNSACPGLKNQIALQGRVACKVIGKINKGDLMIVSMVPGVAMASEDPKTGSIIGKALANYDSDRVGFIEVMVGKH